MGSEELPKATTWFFAPGGVMKLICWLNVFSLLIFFSLTASSADDGSVLNFQGADQQSQVGKDAVSASEDALKNCQDVLKTAQGGSDQFNNAALAFSLNGAKIGNAGDASNMGSQLGNAKAANDAELDDITKAYNGIDDQQKQVEQALGQEKNPIKHGMASSNNEKLKECQRQLDQQAQGRANNSASLAADNKFADKNVSDVGGDANSKTGDATANPQEGQTRGLNPASDPNPSQASNSNVQNPDANDGSPLADSQPQKSGNTDTQGGTKSPGAGNQAGAGNSGGGSGSSGNQAGSGQQQGGGSGSGGGGGGMPDLSGLASALANQPQQTPTPTPTPQLACTAGVVGCVCPSTNPNCAASSTASAAAGLYPAIGNPAYSPTSATTGTATAATATSRALLSPEAKRSVIDRMIEQAPSVIASHDGTPAPKAVLLTKAVQTPATPVAVVAKAAPVKAVVAKAAIPQPRVTAKKNSTTRSRTVAAKKSKVKRAVASTAAPVRTKIQAVSK